jgi:hypothetical protein
VGHIVDIGKCARNENVSLALDGQDWICGHL